MLLKRYSNIEYIRTLKPVKLSKLLAKAYEKELEHTAWEYWLTLDNQTKSSTPFNKFLEELKGQGRPNHPIQTDEDIIEDSQRILKMMKRS